MLSLGFEEAFVANGVYVPSLIECEKCQNNVELIYTSYNRCPYCWEDFPIYHTIGANILDRITFYNK